MTTSHLHRLQKEIRTLVASHYHPTATSNPMDPAFLIWKHGPTLAWALGQYAEALEAGLPQALRRPSRKASRAMAVEGANQAHGSGR